MLDGSDVLNVAAVLLGLAVVLPDAFGKGPFKEDFSTDARTLLFIVIFFLASTMLVGLVNADYAAISLAISIWSLFMALIALNMDWWRLWYWPQKKRELDELEEMVKVAVKSMGVLGAVETKESVEEE